MLEGVPKPQENTQVQEQIKTCHNTLGFFCWGRSLNIHIEIKRELFTLPSLALLHVKHMLFVVRVVCGGSNSIEESPVV